MNLFFRQEMMGEEKKLVLDVGEEMEIDSFALNMMRHNAMSYLVPVQMVSYNCDSCLQYDVGNKETLNGKLSEVLKKGEVIQLFNSIINAFEEAEDYMLSEEGLFLNLNYIFVDETYKCNFLYLPFKQEYAADKIAFLQKLAEQIHPDDMQKDTYIYNIQNAFSRGAIRKLSDLKELMRRNSADILPLKEEERVQTNAVPVSEKQQMQPEVKAPVRSNVLTPPQMPEKKSSIPVLNIPGKGEIPVKIPEEDKPLVNMAAKSDKVSKTRQAKKENKKSGFFGKLSLNKKEPEAVCKMDGYNQKPYLREDNGNNKHTDDVMYESYEQTVMMQPEHTAENDEDRTVYLGAMELTAVLERKKNGEHIRVSGVNAVVGSGSAADCQIADNKAISRSHATIYRRSGSFCIEDNHSSNGTWVNGSRLTPGQPAELENGTQIKLANEEFIFILQ